MPCLLYRATTGLSVKGIMHMTGRTLPLCAYAINQSLTTESSPNRARVVAAISSVIALIVVYVHCMNFLAEYEYDGKT